MLRAGAHRVLQALWPIFMAVMRTLKVSSDRGGRDATDEESVSHVGKRYIRREVSGDPAESSRALQESREMLEQERRRASQVEAEHIQSAQATEDVIGHLKADLSARDHSIQRLEARYRALARQFEDQRQLLQARSAELRVAHTFLTKTDTVSVTEIKSMMTDLNTDIFQSAATLADLLDFRRRTEYGVAEAMQAQDRDIAWLTPDSARALGTANDSSILQSMIQGVICYWCSLIINGWPCQMSENAEHTREEYRGLYQHIAEYEPQAVAGRWRSLSRQHLRERTGEVGGEVGWYLSRASTDVGHLFRPTGCVSDKELQSLIDHTVQDKLRDIIRFALRIREVIGENITSCDFTVLEAHEDEAFNGQWMQEDGVDPSEYQDNPDGSQVLCTTELGLSRAETVTMEDGSQRTQDVILKAKVALTSLLLASTLPTPPKKRARRHRAAGDDKQVASRASTTR
ncbi:hypothetical protein OE88DRAFT_1660031 [Heliocybe sulcata]|uniref:Uncharacterized protein n=1 Tax=Heliocybe sulcata TaxID=5364 RepID=A0A5C3N1I6_9AGAM|nr:hypothetical protein OE88DRAFT_1660031 [Heliocybe sulcata]